MDLPWEASPMSKILVGLAPREFKSGGDSGGEFGEWGEGREAGAEDRNGWVVV